MENGWGFSDTIVKEVGVSVCVNFQRRQHALSYSQLKSKYENKYISAEQENDYIFLTIFYSNKLDYITIFCPKNIYTVYTIYI